MGFSNQQLQQTTFYSYTKQDNQYNNNNIYQDFALEIQLLMCFCDQLLFHVFYTFFVVVFHYNIFWSFFSNIYIIILWIPQWHYLQQTMEYNNRVALDCYRLFQQLHNITTSLPPCYLVEVISNSIANKQTNTKKAQTK